MSRVANKFTDPKTGISWLWPINHNDESGSASKGGGQAGLNHNITTSAPVGAAGSGRHIRQQAANDPISFSLKGTALTRAQHKTFIAWWLLCQSQTIYFTDFSGDEFEVLITSYIPQRKPTVMNRNDQTNAPTWIYDYQIDMDVVRVLDGDYVGVIM